MLDHQAEITWFKAKIADLEDRSRSNNLKFRGIPESVTSHELPRYIQLLMKALLPTLSDMDLTVDRAHRLTKPPFLHAKIPRDTLARIHFYNVKEAVMSVSRRLQSLSDTYGAVTIYSDLSAHTIKPHKELGPITKILQENKIMYKWGHPMKLLFTKQGKQEQITSLEAGWRLLKTWQLVPQNYEPPAHHKHPSHFQMEWSQELGPTDPS